MGKRKDPAGWSHGRRIGDARLMEIKAQEIKNCPSASPAAKAVAEEIAEKATQLQRLLREKRIDG